MPERTSYGTLNLAAASVRDTRETDEEQPYQTARMSKSRLAEVRRKLMVDVSRDWADVVLILCYLITGLLDSASISIWGSFVSMQTGTCGKRCNTAASISCSLMGLY